MEEMGRMEVKGAEQACNSRGCVVGASVWVCVIVYVSTLYVCLRALAASVCCICSERVGLAVCLCGWR